MLETTGEMAEWSIAAVLKTVELRGSGGSNPSLSAREYINKKIESYKSMICGFFITTNSSFQDFKSTEKD